MTQRALPAAAVLARSTSIRSACPPKALNAWNPGVRAATDTNNTISVFDVIGEDWWTGEGVTSKRVAGALRAIGDQDVVVNINSPGGDYFEGLAIYNLLREHPGRVTVNVLGIAASAASVIAMAGDEVRVARAGFLMIHNTWVLAMGDRHELKATADWLAPFDQTAVDIYAARSGGDPKVIAGQLDRETWIGGAEAVAQGFADSLLATDEVTDDPKNRDRNGQIRAERTVDNMGRLSGASRSEIRDLLQTLKSVKPGADQTGTRDAADSEGVLRSLVADLRSV